MNYYPAGWEIPKAVGRVIFWVVPCLFAGPNPYHGYNPIWLYILIPGLWVFGAFARLFFSTAKESKIFYGGWLVAIASLAWWQHIPPNYAF
jgi:hypothetical protein